VVAEWLDMQHRNGKLRLLAGGAAVAPIANPLMLGMKVRGAPDGRNILYVQVRQALDGDYPVWDGRSEEGPQGLRRHQEFWTYDRTTFEAVFPVPVNRGGARRTVNREIVLVEAAMALYEDGLPPRFSLESFCNAVSARLGGGSPGLTLLKEILRPLYRRLQTHADSR
jgi:hypothetical protein